MTKVDKRRKPAAKLVRASLHNASPLSRPVAQATEKTTKALPLQARSELKQPVALRVLPVSRTAQDTTEFRVPPRILVEMKRSEPLRFHPLALKYGVNESSVLRVLMTARNYVIHGWCQQTPWCDESGDSKPESMGPATHFSLVGAVRTAGAGGLVAEYALRLLKNVVGEWNLGDWNDNPVRTRAQVVALLDASVEAAGGAPRRRGGWVVGEVA